MQSIWWKILSIFIIIYVLVFGMLVPLKPGVEKISISNAKAGDSISFLVYGYNTAFGEAKSSNRAWLTIDSNYAISANGVVIENVTTMKLSFVIPKFLPYDKPFMDASLVIDNDADGAFVHPAALSLSQDSINLNAGTNTWIGKPNKLHKTPFMTFPYRNLLMETIRNTYFHVSLWFAMIILFMVSGWHSFTFLTKKQRIDDQKAIAFTQVGLLFGILGIITGAIWAKNTWGAYWNFDVKQNMAAVCTLIYGAYFVLRGSFEDDEKSGRLSAIYNIFAFAAMIPLLFVIPRLSVSLHPGNGGNPAFGGEDLDNTMRMIFYPAIIGFSLFGAWLSQLLWRAAIVKDRLLGIE